MQISYVNIGVVGMSGFGKTVLCSALIRPLQRVVVFDYQHDEAFDNLTVNWKQRELPELLSKTEFQIVIRRSKHEQEYLDALDLCMTQTAHGHLLHDATILFDEMAIYAPSRKMPDAVKEVVFRGRRKGLSIIWNTQRPKEVNGSVRSQTHVYIVFRLEEELDTTYFKLEPAESKLIQSLSRGQYRIKRDKTALLRYLRESALIAEQGFSDLDF